MIEEKIENIMPDVVEAPPAEVEVEEEENILPEPVKPEPINPDEIFKKTPTIKPVVKDKPPKKKRVMSEEQLKKLALAREKANAKRIENARLRKEAKLKGEKPVITKKEKAIAEYQESQKPVVQNITHEHKTINNNITPEDIERIAVQASGRATAKALEQYETIRKARKAEKKKVQAVEREKAVIHNKINTALGRKYGDNNFFDTCF